MSKIEEAIRLLAQHAPSDIRQQVEAMLAKPESNGKKPKKR